MFRISRASARISISPVDSFGLTVPSGRLATLPVTETTYSAAERASGVQVRLPPSGPKTTWVLPYRSRRSTKSVPPWSR